MTVGGQIPIIQMADVIAGMKEAIEDYILALQKNGPPVPRLSLTRYNRGQ